MPARRRDRNSKTFRHKLGGQYHRNDGSGTEVDCAMIVFCRFDYECHVEIAVPTPGAYRQPFRQLKRNLDGFKQDSRSHAASRWLAKQNIENNPMQSTRQLPGRTLWARDRDRGEPRGSAPPTPPYVRVRIRRFEKNANALRSNDSTRVGWAFGFMHHRERFDVFPQRLPGFTRRRR